MSTRRLIALRHGQTDWNAQGRFQGQTDIPLNEEGKRQAHAAALAISKFAPSAIVSSDLSRASDTAGALAAECGLDVLIDPRLREVFVGTWEGLTRIEIAERFPEEWARWNAREDFRRGGGETRAEVAERTGSAIRDHVRDPSMGDTIVVVGHGMAMHAALDWLHENGVIHLDAPVHRMPNASWIVADIVVPVNEAVPTADSPN